MTVATRSLLFSGLALLLSCAASSDVMRRAPPPKSEPVADVATVTFLCPSNSMHGTRFQVWDRTEFLGLALPASYFTVQCPPGNHLFLVTAENRVAVEAELAAGRRYYIQLGAERGAFRARAVATAVTRKSDSWDKVETMLDGLTYLEPIESSVRIWEERRRPDAAELTAWFTTNPDRERYLDHLAASDGR